MSEQFTPGPWEIYAQPIESGQQAKDEFAFQIDSTSPIGPALYLIDAGGKCAAITGCGPTSEANAHLIKAAPDMFAALVWAERALAPFSKEPAEKSGINMIRAALAKASPDDLEERLDG